MAAESREAPGNKPLVILSEAEGPPISFFLYVPIEFTISAPMGHDYLVYILTDKARSTLYIGIANNLPTRLWQHRNPEKASFSQRYHCILLVHYEHYADVNAAIAREKQLKGWRRSKKIALVEAKNPRWEDLSGDIL